MSQTKERLFVTPLEDIMGERFGRYSKYIIQERALPDARDGLKPVQRRILYAMNKEGNTHDKKYRKSAKSVGIIMGNYHPHGDSSIYDAMVRLSQDWKSRTPLIDMQGNNGSIDDDPAAAMRYTEVRLSAIAQMLLQDIEKETVVFAPNFDDSELEPTVLPARYPNLLTNGISGIASGYATNIPPHNLNEVIDACVYQIQNPNARLDELMEYIQGPDFPTGGIVQGIEGIREAFMSGKGRIIIKAKADIIATKTIQQIVIHEIPYDVVKSNLVKKMDEIRINKDIDGIIDVRDESDRNGLRIVVDIKRDVDANLILNYMYKHTDLQISFNYNIVAIVNQRPEQLGLKAMLHAFIEHRTQVVLKRSAFAYDRKEKRCHILEGLIQSLSILDEVIAIIRSAKDKADAKAMLIQAYQFSEVQAEAIVSLRLYRLSNTDVRALRDEFALLVNEMEELQEILNNRSALRRVIIKELKEVKKHFITPRKSKIEDKIEEIKIDKVQMIANDRYMLTLSKDAYAKRVSLRSFSASEGLSGTKEGDHLFGEVEVNNLDILLFFSNLGTYGFLPVYELNEHKWKDVGTHLNTKIKMSGDEKLINAFVVCNFKQEGYIVSLSKHGMIKKTAIIDYEVSRNSKTMTSMKIAKDDRVIGSYLAYEGDDIIIVTRNGFSVRYEVSQIPSSATKSKGVKAMNLNKDVIIGASIINKSQEQILLVCESGVMKRLKCEDFDLMNRPVKGSLLHKQIKSNPNYLRYVRNVSAADQLCFVDEEVHQIAAKDVAIMGKDASFSNVETLQDNFYMLKNINIVENIALQEKDEEETSFQQSSFAI